MPQKNKSKLTPAEKQRLYRERIQSDPVKAEAAKEKERKRWHERRQQKKVKGIADMTPRQARRARSNWRNAYHERKAKKENLERIEQQEAEVIAGTPPTSPPHSAENVIPDHALPEPGPSVSSKPSSQKKRGRKVVRRDRSACYRRNKKLQAELEEEKKKIQRLRKQLSREKLKVSIGQKRKLSDTTKDTATPRKQARVMLNSGKAKVRRELIFDYALTAQIKQGKLATNKSQKTAQIFSKLFGHGSILRKYKMLTKAEKAGLLSKKKILHSNKKRKMNLLAYEREKKINSISEDVKERIIKFFERDDVSWCAPGKKQVMTCK